MHVTLNQVDHLPRFIELNKAWISHYFPLEEVDKKLAENPYKIVDDGGCILSLLDNDVAVGVCALFKDSETRYQLARMAVDTTLRGKGYGNALMLAAIAHAKSIGADLLYLLSNTKLAAALALYRKHGFRSLSEGAHPVYARCDIVMELRLT
jgi:ribosomal protein S18 acetylase RimI-like enzyme